MGGKLSPISGAMRAPAAPAAGKKPTGGTRGALKAAKSRPGGIVPTRDPSMVPAVAAMPPMSPPAGAPRGIPLSAATRGGTAMKGTSTLFGNKGKAATKGGAGKKGK